MVEGADAEAGRGPELVIGGRFPEIEDRPVDGAAVVAGPSFLQDLRGACGAAGSSAGVDDPEEVPTRAGWARAWTRGGGSGRRGGRKEEERRERDEGGGHGSQRRARCGHCRRI